MRILFIWMPKWVSKVLCYVKKNYFRNESKILEGTKINVSTKKCFFQSPYFSHSGNLNNILHVKYNSDYLTIISNLIIYISTRNKIINVYLLPTNVSFYNWVQERETQYLCPSRRFRSDNWLIYTKTNTKQLLSKI